jgi:hypothetical protein
MAGVIYIDAQSSPAWLFQHICLPRRRYTAPGRICLSHFLAYLPAMFIGHAMNARPDLFSSGCAVMHQPLLDPIGDIQYFASGLPTEAPGFDKFMLELVQADVGPIAPGVPWNGTKEVYDYVKSYAPYDNVRAQAYPALLITSSRFRALSTNSSQRSYNYWAGPKFAAKVREARTDGQLLLVRTFMDAPDQGAVEDVSAMHQAFILSFFGLSDAPSGGTGTGRKLVAAAGDGAAAASKYATKAGGLSKHKKAGKTSHGGARKLLLGSRDLQGLTMAAQPAYLAQYTAALGTGQSQLPMLPTAARTAAVSSRASGLRHSDGGQVVSKLVQQHLVGMPTGK